MTSFLNNVEFDKEIILKEPKKVKTKKRSRKAARIQKRVIQLVFYIIVLIFLWVAGSEGLLRTVSFIKGHEFNSWQEIKEDYGDYKKSQEY